MTCYVCGTRLGWHNPQETAQVLGHLTTMGHTLSEAPVCADGNRCAARKNRGHQ